jgi:hypothetical protein
MTDFWQYLLAFWLAGALLSMWKIYFPSLKIINKVAPQNILAQRPILSSIIVFSIFFIFLPFMVLTLLIPERLEKFANGFVKGALGDNNGDRKN